MILFAYALVCLIFGTTFLAIKIGVDAGAPPFFSGLKIFCRGRCSIPMDGLETKSQLLLAVAQRNVVHRVCSNLRHLRGSLLG